ncbi:MAG: hypothetical protein JW862_15575 [Anaerolineales bacterium]|nr:hypothetical protein [Anaerolineales bacterium]
MPDPLSLLRAPEPARQKPRQRDWEKQHCGYTVRNVPVDLRKEIKAIAQQNACSADAVAQAFLEYALACYDQGGLKLTAVLRQGVRTITWEERKSNPIPPPARKKAEPQSIWKNQVTYRLPIELIEHLKSVSNNLAVGRGIVLMRLLQHSLEAYQSGLLVLVTSEK